MCRWWNRWLHRKKREADTIWLLPALQAAAMERTTEDHMIDPDGWERDVQARVDAGFALHKQLPGQEHWHCDCARADGYV